MGSRAQEEVRKNKQRQKFPIFIPGSHFQKFHFQAYMRKKHKHALKNKTN